ncbi:MAG TPA: hypothetical protein DEQ32_11650 [Gammaproteobacteria bacterium]|nr:hypothetical protein [Gammaproteobacteria bacterium]|tara:strand:- start:492 stop:797 length:306 start_codon:yes stop_codon:yes gene_type:complete
MRNNRVVKFVEVVQNNSSTGSSYHLQEVFINPNHIVYIRNASWLKAQLNEGNLPGGLDGRQSFSTIHLSRGSTGIDINVVGEPSAVREKIGIPSQQELLQG